MKLNWLLNQSRDLDIRQSNISGLQKSVKRSMPDQTQVNVGLPRSGQTDVRLGAPEVVRMDLKLSEPGQIELKEMSKEDLAKVMVELIRSDGRLRSVIMDIVFSCPNIVTQI